MSRRSHRRVVLAAVLAVALALAAPVHAAGRAGWMDVPDLVQQAWDWFAGLWPAAGTSHGRGPGSGTGGGLPQKEGLGVDPDGSHVTGTVPSGGQTQSGAGVDPNG
jgi:hypothetical protein